MSLKTTSKEGGYQQITDLSSSVGLTIPTGDDGTKMTMAMITVEAQAVRWRDDLTAPTATVGMPAQVNDVLFYDGNLSRIRFIEEVAGAILNISYYA